MKLEIIDGGEARYLSELPEFQDGLPHGIVNKTKTDVGGTYVAVNCDSNYIIVCPFRDLVDSIAADNNNRYEVFKCYGGTKEAEFRDYIRKHETHKIAVTFDRLPTLLKWMDYNTAGFKLLVDEYQIILEDIEFRESAIMGMCKMIQYFEHYTFLSATPIDEDYEIDLFKQLPHYKVVWDKGQEIIVKKLKTSNLPKGLCNLIKIFCDEGISLPDINGEQREVEHLFIFLNSVTTIKQVLSTLELNRDDVKVCCAEKPRNGIILDSYPIESAIAPNKRINFFTKKCFQGCNLFSNNALVIVASDAYRTHTLVDISTTMEQISGRLRCNKEYQNVFRNIMVHLYSTNQNVQSDEEFEADLKQKEEDATHLLSLQKKANESELEVLIKRVNVETDLLTLEDGRLVYNRLKKQSLRFKHAIRMAYKDGIYLSNAYDKSEKLVQTKQEDWAVFDGKLARAVTFSYEQLLREYLDHPSEAFEVEYPEFKDFRLYLTEKEMNSCRWNKEKMMKVIKDKKKLQQAFRAIYHKGEFISDKELKLKLADQFKRLGILLSPKATQIKECSIYKVERCSQYIDGKKVNGYRFGDTIFDFRL